MSNLQNNSIPSLQVYQSWIVQTKKGKQFYKICILYQKYILLITVITVVKDITYIHNKKSFSFSESAVKGNKIIFPILHIFVFFVSECHDSGENKKIKRIHNWRYDNIPTGASGPCFTKEL